MKNIFFLSKIGSGFGESGYTSQSSPVPIYSFDQPFSQTLVPEALRFSQPTTLGGREDNKQLLDEVL